jgi:hypothetical protein
VIAGHEEALQKVAPEFLEAYRAVNRLAARVLSHDTANMLNELKAICVTTEQSPKIKGGQA